MPTNGLHSRCFPPSERSFFNAQTCFIVTHPPSRGFLASSMDQPPCGGFATPTLAPVPFPIPGITVTTVLQWGAGVVTIGISTDGGSTYQTVPDDYYAVNASKPNGENVIGPVVLTDAPNVQPGLKAVLQFIFMPYNTPTSFYQCVDVVLQA